MACAANLSDVLTVSDTVHKREEGTSILRCAWVFTGLFSVIGCVDRSPTTLDSADSGSKRVVAKEMAAGSNNPKELLDRAFAAFGGDSARKKLKTCRITTRMFVAIPALTSKLGYDTTIIEDCFCDPDKWRRSTRRISDGKEVLLFVLNGDHYWAREIGKKVREMPLPPVNTRKPAMLVTLDNLVGLRQSNAEITIGAEEEVAGKTMIPLIIMASGHPRSATYLDRSTSLIAKETKYFLPRMQDPPETWKQRGPAEMETTYSDYKSFEGVVLPTHMVSSQAGKTLFEVSLLEVEFPLKFEADVFDKPKDE